MFEYKFACFLNHFCCIHTCILFKATPTTSPAITSIATTLTPSLIALKHNCSSSAAAPGSSWSLTAMQMFSPVKKSFLITSIAPSNLSVVNDSNSIAPSSREPQGRYDVILFRELIIIITIIIITLTTINKNTIFLKKKNA